MQTVGEESQHNQKFAWGFGKGSEESYSQHQEPTVFKAHSKACQSDPAPVAVEQNQT